MLPKFSVTLMHFNWTVNIININGLFGLKPTILLFVFYFSHLSLFPFFFCLPLNKLNIFYDSILSPLLAFKLYFFVLF